jgi:hypothetical protein
VPNRYDGGRPGFSIRQSRPSALMRSSARCDSVRKDGIKPVIPGRSNRKKRIRHDKQAYKDRNVIERCYGLTSQIAPHRTLAGPIAFPLGSGWDQATHHTEHHGK